LKSFVKLNLYYISYIIVAVVLYIVDPLII